MPTRPRPRRPLRRARIAVNAAIRRLMEDPPSPDRTAQWQRLLVEWRELHDDDVTPAA
ncbi:hypothetical protein ACOZDE_18570 [Streptomyces griseoincarnatus]